jgi:DNA-binding winged helix-turn-helix (wHTH) protein/tetratricopeptide (TPR) repeat protein
MSNNGLGLYEFGPFRLDAGRRLLLRDDQPIPLQPKAFDTLLVLVRNSEKVVLKGELLDAVWADTFVEESNLTQNISVLRKALGDVDAERRYIITVPGRGYRFGEKVRVAMAQAVEPVGAPVSPDLLAAASAPPTTEAPSVITAAKTPARATFWRRQKAVFGVVAAVLALALLLFGYSRMHHLPKLGEKDTVVLGDFSNTTGDAVFDGTLRQGLSAQLEQSPFLNLLTEQRISQTLALMAQPRDTKLTPALAREVCARTSSAAVLQGSIAQVGSRYLLTLTAENCATGDVLASAAAQASDKGRVLDALGGMASDIRGKLGESLASIQRFDTPLENVTTSSLEALQAYTLAHAAQAANAAQGGNPLYERAVQLDPNFATAYLGMGVNYFNMDEPTRAAECLQKAYDLRERVSEREKLGIETMYEAVGMGDFDAAVKTNLLAMQLYPRDPRATANLGTFYSYLGDYEKSLSSIHETLARNGDAGQSYSNLLVGYLHVGRMQDAKAAARQALEHHFDSTYLHYNLYLVDFLQGDATGMERDAAEIAGSPDGEDVLLYYQSDTAAYHGQFAQARALTRKAAAVASREDKKEATAAFTAEAAVREAVVGNFPAAKQQAKTALALSTGKDVAAMSAIALGLAGDSATAASLAGDLNKRFPRDTAVQYNFLPCVHAAVALRASQPAKAIAALVASSPHELGQTAQSVTFVLYPVYLRGEAYLASKQPAEAEAEFQKILDHPGLVENEPIGSLAHLGIARAYSLAHDTLKAQASYADFLALWKNADPDLPVLKEAKSESARLH